MILDLLTDYDFTMLQNDSKLILIHIWLLASKLGVDEPKIPNDIKWICKQTNLEGRFSLKELFDNGFIRMIQNDIIEIQNDTDSFKINIKNINNINNINKIKNKAESEPDYECLKFFEKDWKTYPRKAGDKKKAEKCYLKTVGSVEKRILFLEKMKNYIESVKDLNYLKHGETFFRNWENLEVEVQVEEESWAERYKKRKELGEV